MAGDPRGGDQMLRGVVDRVVPDGKFGFIVGPNGEESFFHQSALKETEVAELAPGVPVEFHAETATDPGDRPDEHLPAFDVRLTDDAVPAVDNELLPVEKVGPPAS
jgi:cold shock CspA family protein